jgi:hypothetical protein
MTSRTLKQVSWLAALTLGAGLGLSTPAEACSAPVCEPDVEAPLPTNPGTVPANVPTLVLLTEGAEVITSGESAPRLLRSNGERVELSTVASRDEYHVWHVRPASPLVPGETYRLQGVAACTLPSGSSQSLEVSFTAGAASPLPTATGTLRVETTARGKVRVAHGSLCSTEQDSSYVRLGFTPAPELVPFLPWVSWSLEVDGQPWALERHGAVLPDGTLAPPTRRQLGFGARRLFLVHAGCANQEPDVGDKGLMPGKHRATLRPVLAQSSTSLPPVEVDFELSCESRTPSEPPRDIEQLPLLGHGCSHTGGAGMLALPLLLSIRFLVRRRTHHVPRSGS